MKILLIGLLTLGTATAFANEEACREAIEQVSTTSSLLKEYELKQAVGPEMEEFRINTVNLLTYRLDVKKEAAVTICSGK